MQTSAAGLRRVTREEMKFIDTMATTAYGLPAMLLMENAGRETAEAALALLKEKRDPGGFVVVLASTGNNGGDGFVAARYLVNAGREVRAFLVGRTPEAATSETAANLKILKRMGLVVEEVKNPVAAIQAADRCKGAVLVVDALLGTGFSAIAGGLKEPISNAMDLIAQLGVPVVSADIPSGLDANTGEVIGKAVKADWTVTFGLPKKGFDAPGAAAYLGRLTVADLGLPKSLLEGKPASGGAA